MSFRAVLIFLISCVIISSGYEAFLYYNINDKECDEKNKSAENWSRSQQIFVSFSIFKNTRTLFAESSQRIAAIDTIRLLFIINVYVVHEYILPQMLSYIALNRISSSVAHKLLYDNRYFFVRNQQIIDGLFVMRQVFIIKNLNINLHFIEALS